MSFSFFDLHCDTATELYHRGERLTQNSLAVSLNHASEFERYAQVMAIWTDDHLDDETGWNRLHAVLQYLREDPAIQSGDVQIVKSLPRNLSGTFLLPAVEDARILNGRLKRVESLYDLGFRILTPLWSGETCIGGSHDTSSGLTAFGKAAVSDAVELGMIADISHASQRSASDIFEISAKKNRPVIASHSNAYAKCPVSRNLRDWQIREIRSVGGLIGLNLYIHFLSDAHPASREDVLRHMEYFLEQDCENILCFGADMDGAEMPPDLPNLSSIPTLREFLSHYYSESVLNKIFYENAYYFAERNFGSSAENL